MPTLQEEILRILKNPPRSKKGNQPIATQDWIVSSPDQLAKEIASRLEIDQDKIKGEIVDFMGYCSVRYSGNANCGISEKDLKQIKSVATALSKANVIRLRGER